MFFIVSLSWCITSFAASESQSELQDIQQKITNQEEIIKQRQKKRRSLQNQLRQQENNIVQITLHIRSAQGALKKLEKDISDITLSISKKKKQETIQQDML